MSKCLLPGLRFGCLVVPETLVTATMNRHLVTNWMATALIAEIATRWIEDGTADDLLRWQRGAIARRNRLAATLLEGVPHRGMEHGLHIWMPLEGPGARTRSWRTPAHQGVAVAAGSGFAIGDEASAPRGSGSASGAPATMRWSGAWPSWRGWRETSRSRRCWRSERRRSAADCHDAIFELTCFCTVSRFAADGRSAETSAPAEWQCCLDAAFAEHAHHAQRVHLEAPSCDPKARLRQHRRRDRANNDEVTQFPNGRRNMTGRMFRLLGATAAIAIAASAAQRRHLALRLRGGRGAGPDYAQKFKEHIEANSDHEIQLFPYGTLGESADIMEQTQAGVLQFADQSPGFTGALIPEAQVFSVPYLLPADYDELDEFFRDSTAINEKLRAPLRGPGPRAVIDVPRGRGSS